MLALKTAVQSVAYLVDHSAALKGGLMVEQKVDPSVEKLEPRKVEMLAVYLVDLTAVMWEPPTADL